MPRPPLRSRPSAVARGASSHRPPRAPPSPPPSRRAADAAGRRRSGYAALASRWRNAVVAVGFARALAAASAAPRVTPARSRTSLFSSARNDVYGVRMPCSVARATSSFTSSSLRPLRSSSSMISPTRRVAHSLATKAFVSSSLLATSSAGKSNDFSSSPILPRELHLGGAAACGSGRRARPGRRRTGRTRRLG